MGQFDNLPNSNNSQDNRPAEEVLVRLTQDLQQLQRNLTTQLAQDIDRLQRQKRRLMDDIEALEQDYDSLQGEYQALQADQATVLSQQQLAQQQLWAKRLAQALASHLYARLKQTPAALDPVSGVHALPQTHQMLTGLDEGLHRVLQSLQQDLNSYQSSLSQQISRMSSLEQQGEALIEALVNRLSQQLQAQMTAPPMVQSRNGTANLPPTDLLTWQQRPDGPSTPSLPLPPPFTPPRGLTSVNGYPRNASGAVSPPLQGTTPLTDTVPPGSDLRSQTRSGSTRTPSSPPTAGRSSSALQTGILLIVCSTLVLSVHNVIVGLIGYGGEILGRIPVSGIFPLDIPNSLMLLWLRMVVVLPLMLLLARQLYPQVGRDIKQFFNGQDVRPVLQVMASGGFLFLSQVLIYKAISDIGPGVAVTLLFMYPLITVPLAWFLFGDRPTPLRLVVMFAISMGIVFTAMPRIGLDLSGGIVSPWGIAAALLSSAAFALYLIAMQLSFRRLHPVPVSIIQFSTIFVLTSLLLIGGSFVGIRPSEPSSQLGLYLGGLLLGLLTLLGYLFNNYGVRLIGAAQASIIASSGPVITAIMAYLITPGEKSSLEFIQWIGVLMVTLGVISLSLERLTSQRRKKRQQQINQGQAE